MATFYVVGKEQFYNVKEPGYKAVNLHEKVDFENLPWGDYKLIIENILSKKDDDFLGFCLYNYYFLDGVKLVTVKQIEDLLNEYDVVFSDDEAKKNSAVIISSTKLEEYYQYICSDEAEETYMEEWSINQGLRVGYISGQKIDIDRIHNTYDEIRKLTSGIVERYKKYGYEPLECINQSVRTTNKTPIWLCWWQGEDSMPSIVKGCVSSIRKAFPKEQVEIHIITLENYLEYVHFPDIILKRFEEGALSYTHLSDVLRAELLCMYGGIWLDATCLILDDRFIDTLLKYPFFTRKQGAEDNELDIVLGRWSTYFMKGPANFKLFRFWVDAFELYWTRYSSLTNYFIFDFITLVAYNEFPDVKFVLDAVPINNEAVEVLAKWCNEAYDERKMQALRYKNWLFKMTYKKDYHIKTPDGKDTFYAHIENYMNTICDVEEKENQSIKKFSVIIPCYNAEDYLEECLDSIVGQTIGIDKLEIILVDDCSTDRTVSIMKQYEALYPDSIMIILLEQNGKQGKARNIGIGYASSEYISFIDADDKVRPDMFAILSTVLDEYRVDLIQFRYRIFRNNEKIDNETISIEECINNGELSIYEYGKNRKQYLLNSNVLNESCWQKIYRREMVINNNLKFMPGVGYEEPLFTYPVKYLVDRVAVLEKPLYYYRENIKGTTLSYMNNPATIVDHLRVQLELRKYIEEYLGIQEYGDEMDLYFLHSFLYEPFYFMKKRGGILPASLWRFMKKNANKYVPNAKNNPYLSDSSLQDERIVVDFLDIEEPDDEKLQILIEELMKKI